jgi:hypothetical protein
LFLKTNQEFRSVLPGSHNSVVFLHKIICLQQDIWAQLYTSSIATRPGKEQDEKAAKNFPLVVSADSVRSGSRPHDTPGTRAGRKNHEIQNRKPKERGGEREQVQ